MHVLGLEFEQLGQRILTGHGLVAATASCPPAFSTRSGLSLTVALLGFFVITLDAVVVNVALPSMRDELGAGMTGLQWVVDGDTLMFAALLLSAGSLSTASAPARPSGLGWRCSSSPAAQDLLAAPA